jgi:hypothetical protein
MTPGGRHQSFPEHQQCSASSFVNRGTVNAAISGFLAAQLRTGGRAEVSKERAATPLVDGEGTKEITDRRAKFREGECMGSAYDPPSRRRFDGVSSSVRLRFSNPVSEG